MRTRTRGTPLPEVAAKRLEGLPERGKAAQRFRPAHDGHALGALDEAAPRRRPCAAPPMPASAEAGRQRPERARQRGPVEVPRRLAGHHEDVSRAGRSATPTMLDPRPGRLLLDTLALEQEDALRFHRQAAAPPAAQQATVSGPTVGTSSR